MSAIQTKRSRETYEAHNYVGCERSAKRMHQEVVEDIESFDSDCEAESCSTFVLLKAALESARARTSCFDNADNIDVDVLRTHLEDHGFVIIKNAVSEKSLSDIRCALGIAVCKQWAYKQVEVVIYTLPSPTKNSV